MRRARTKRIVGTAGALLLAGVFLQTACTTSGGAKATAVPTNTPAAANPTWTPFPTDTETMTVSSTASRTVTRTWTQSYTFTQTPTFTDTPTPCSTPQGNVVSINVDCWNGGGCVVCGNTQYACISAPSNCTFTDPCPGGQTAVQLIATSYGLNCSTAGATYTTACNGTTINTTTGIAYNCSCNNCQVWCHDSGYYGSGFPGWVSGGTNTFTIQVNTSYCMSSVSLQVGCQ